MGSLKQLTTLALQYNKLTGQIPLSLGNLENLSRLNLSFNNFTGSIPATLATIAHLEVLDIQNNSLSGIVPSGMLLGSTPLNPDEFTSDTLLTVKKIKL